MTNSMTEIPLSKAPRNFFDQDKWAEYVAHFDTEEIALMRLARGESLPQPGSSPTQIHAGAVSTAPAEAGVLDPQ